MASDLHLQKVTSSEEDEFHKIVKQIGGKGNVYLVCDVGSEEGECKCGLMKEFVADVFPVDDLQGQISSNGEVSSECCSRSKGQCKPDKVELAARIRTKSEGRAMQCAVVIFIFRHAYIHEKATRVCVKEVLKDVRSRTAARPAIIGLVHAHCESPETGESVLLLEQMLRSVFTKHPHDSIWAGHFVPKVQDGVHVIRRNICRAVLCATQTTDNTLGRKSFSFWPLRQWLRRRRRRSEQAEAASNNQVQRGNEEGAEEGIPLQMRAGQH